MDLFATFGAELPLPTRILIATVNVVTAYKLVILGGSVIVIAGLFLATRTDTGRLLFDRTTLKIPLAGRIVIQVALARMCRLIALCLRAGVVLPEIVEMTIRTQGNRVIRSALQEVHTELLQGQGLADPLAKFDKIFPGMLVQMVRVGEETGSLESDMDTFATFYEEEADRSIDSLTRALEPALTIFVALIVGFVAVSIVTPMYSLMQSIE
jgi:type IV pilus assembly protein PilC